MTKHPHVCLGISPFNSLFSEQYIEHLIGTALEHFESFHLFVPDVPTYYTLKALGYDDARIKHKMKKQLNWLKNKMIKALNAHGYFGPEAEAKIINGAWLEQSSVYQSRFKEVEQRYLTDTYFRARCLEASYWVLEGKLDRADITPYALENAVRYFLAEIPLFAWTPEILGLEASVFAYHQSIPFHQDLLDGKLGLVPSSGQEFLVIDWRRDESPQVECSIG
jgi:cyclo(L-tyrosyl-L-tyrosyl) synthase